MDWAIHIRRILARLGEDVTWTHLGSPATVRGIYVSPYAQVTLGGTVAIAGSDPMFATMSADVPALADGDDLLRGATAYKVRAPEPDELGGFVMMKLEKV